jgi:hypothetical protein
MIAGTLVFRFGVIPDWLQGIIVLNKGTHNDGKSTHEENLDYKMVKYIHRPDVAYCIPASTFPAAGCIRFMAPAGFNPHILKYSDDLVSSAMKDSRINLRLKIC